MKRFLLTGATVVATVVGITAFAIAAPLSPVVETFNAPTPNVAAQYGTPVAPTPPKPVQIKAPVAALKYAALVRTGVLPITMPTQPKGVLVKCEMKISIALARKLGLKITPKMLRAGKKFLVVGTATMTTAKDGPVKVNVKLTPAMKAALKKNAAKKGKVPAVPTTIDFTFSKDKKTSKASKKFTLKR